jgi:hypothetical protein
MIPGHYPAALFFKEGLEVINGRIGAVELDKGRGNEDSAADGAGLPPGGAHLSPSFSLNEKQCFPVERNTSMEGRLRHLMPKTEQDRGKAGSQVIRKY